MHTLSARIRAARGTARPSGFSLVELMVAMVLGLIVSAAVVALVVAIIHANRQTLQATRLNQELRATLAVIANDLRRARSVDDPLSVAVAAGGNPYRAVSTATGGCVIYAYDGAIGGPWHVIRLDAGRVVLQGAAAKPANCTPAGTPEVLGSSQVEITQLSFTPTTTVADEELVRAITVTIAGRLVDDDQSISGITRTMAQTVYVRSIGTGT
jgi:prepilin-type N-terminal cleavage/methylation domain-containing protein